MIHFFEEVIYQLNKRVYYPLVWKSFYFKTQKYHKGKDEFRHNILLIRTDEIGDFIVWLDQAKEYQHIFPNHRIVLLHNQIVSDIANRLPYIDECIPLDKRRIKEKRYCRKIIKKINTYYYDKVIYPSRTRQFELGDWFVHNTYAEEKIGSSVDSDKYNWLCNIFGKTANYNDIINDWYTDIIHISERYKDTIHELEYNHLFLKVAFDYDYTLRYPTIPFEIPRLNIVPNQPYFVFCLGASTENRRWEISKFVELTRNIRNHLIVLVGSVQETPLGCEFTNSLFKCNPCCSVINLIGQTTIFELTSIIKYADMVIGNETSTYHISIATSSPTICILGGGHYKRFAPYPISVNTKNKLDYTISSTHQECFCCNWRCKYAESSPNRCIKDITPSIVLTILKQIYPNP